MGKSLDELRVEAAALQGAAPKSPSKNSNSQSSTPELQEWEKQIMEIDKAKTPKLHMYHDAIVRAINAGTEVSMVMGRFNVSTNTIKSVMKIHNQQTDMNNDKAI